MIDLPLAFLDDESLRWGRVAFLARLIEAERANLDDEDDVLRTLMRNGVSPGEAFLLAPDAIRHAKSDPAPAH